MTQAMVRSGLPLGEALRVAQLGVVAGLRSQLPAALLALAARRREFATRDAPPLGLLRHPAALPLLGASAVGELIGDKLPITPSRLATGPLLGRLALGAGAGAVVAREAGRPVGLSAGLGAAGAALGALAGYHLRAAAGRATRLPDPVCGAIEDVLAIALGVVALRRRRSR